MQFKEVDGQHFRAEKISGTGAIYYTFWHDQRGDDYVQIVKNVGGGGSGNGTYSSDLYAVKDLSGLKPINGYDPLSGRENTTYDNNMPAFLRAIKNDIEARRKAAQLNSHDSDGFI